MKANELRIGNYLNLLESEDDFHEVQSFDEDCMSFKGYVSWNYIGFDEVLPIPLTEKWLLALGFEFYKVLSHYRKVIDDFWYQIKKTPDGQFLFSFTNLSYDEVNHMPPKLISEIHQLQNLFFALTGKELKIKD